MKSRHLSILPDNSVADVTANAADTANAANAGESSANHRARYQAFLNQQSQRNQRKRKSSAPVNIARGLLNFAIFVALFLTILTLLGFGLSRLSGNVKGVNSPVSAPGNQAATIIEASPSPANIRSSGKRQ